MFSGNVFLIKLYIVERKLLFKSKNGKKKLSEVRSQKSKIEKKDAFLKELSSEINYFFRTYF